MNICERHEKLEIWTLNSTKFLFILFFVTTSISSSWANTSLLENNFICKDDQESTWSEQERLVWDSICLGKTFDFNETPGYGGELDARNIENWPSERKLSTRFLRTVLLEEKYKSTLTNHGVRITGAWFEEEIDFSNTLIEHDLWLENSRFSAPVNFFNAKLSQSLSLDLSNFEATVSFQICEIAGVLSLGGVLFEKTFDLSSAKVGANVAITMDAHFKDVVSLRHAKISGNLFIQDTFFDGQLFSSSLKVDQDVVVDGVKFSGRVDMGLSVFGGFFKITKSNFNNVLNLNSITTRHDAYFEGVGFENDFILTSSAIGNDLIVKSINVGQKTYLRSTKTNSNLTIEASKFSGAVYASNLNVKKQLFVKSNSFMENVVMQKYKSLDSVFFHSNIFKSGLSLNSSVLGEQLELFDNKVEGLLYLGSTKIKSHLILKKNIFNGEVDLNYASLGGQIEVQFSKFLDIFKAEDISLSNLYIFDSVFSNELHLLHAKLSGSIIITKSKFDKLLYLGHSSIAKASEISESELSGPLSFASAVLGGRLAVYENNFNDYLDFADSKIFNGLFIASSRFKKDVDFDRSVVKGKVLISENTNFESRVDFEDVEISGSLFISENTVFEKELVANAIWVGGNFQLEDSFFYGKVNMEHAKVDGSLVLGENSVFSDEVSLSQSTILGQLSMSKAHFKSLLNLEAIHARMVFLGEGANFEGDVSLATAIVESELSTSKSTFKKFLGLNTISIGQDLILGDAANFELPISVNRGQIVGDVSFPSSVLFFVDLSGANIGGVLNLGVSGEDDPVWDKNGGIDLGNAKIGSIQVPLNWETSINLDGLIYDHLGGDVLLAKKPMLLREAEWYIKFLQQQENFSPQPYKFLADELEEIGQFEKSSEILYSGRDRDRRNSGKQRWAWLTIQKYLIGYGIGSHIFIVCFWILLFIVIGTVVIFRDKEGRKESRGLSWSIFYSIDKLLPIISLDSDHQDLMPDGKARYYYYFHIFAGYVLALFLVAGISGLTNR